MKWSEHEKVRPVLFAPSVAHRGVGIVEERKGYTVRTSGDVDKRVSHEYECPVHGRFTVEVVNHSVPATVECPAMTLVGVAAGFGTVPARQQRCCLPAQWCGSSRVGIGISSGEVTG